MLIESQPGNHPAYLYSSEPQKWVPSKRARRIGLPTRKLLALQRALDDRCGMRQVLQMSSDAMSHSVVHSHVYVLDICPLCPTKIYRAAKLRNPPQSACMNHDLCAEMEKWSRNRRQLLGIGYLCNVHDRLPELVVKSNTNNFDIVYLLKTNLAVRTCLKGSGFTGLLRSRFRRRPLFFSIWLSFLLFTLSRLWYACGTDKTRANNNDCWYTCTFKVPVSSS